MGNKQAKKSAFQQAVDSDNSESLKDLVSGHKDDLDCIINWKEGKYKWQGTILHYALLNKKWASAKIILAAGDCLLPQRDER